MRLRLFSFQLPGLLLAAASTQGQERERRRFQRPDGKTLAFIAARGGGDEGKSKSAKTKAQVWLLNLGGGEAERLTEVAGGVSGFEWSPDSSKSAFTSRREGDPDRPRNSDIWLIEASEGAEGGPPKYSDYDPDDLTVVSIEGGEPLVLTAKLDRNVHSPRWSQDGARLHFIYADDRVGALAAVPAAGGEIERGLSKPSYVEDRLERMIEWYGKYLLETPEEQSSGGGG